MHIRLSTFLLPLLSCLYISSIFFTTVHAQAFQDATGLSAANEFNFSTQFAQPDGGRPVVMVAEVTPQDELNFYGSNDDGATRSLISTIAQPGNSY
jgi:hypothetical protein